MKKFIFILGGARSGKSRHAVELARAAGQKTVFIATAAPSDEEMAARIKLHQKSRPPHWQTIEEGLDVKAALASIIDKDTAVLIDCLGLWVFNLMSENLTDAEIEKQFNATAEFIGGMDRTVILVSNDVGSGIVPEAPPARRFRDLVGFANQIMAKNADEVILMQAGIALRIK